MSLALSDDTNERVTEWYPFSHQNTLLLTTITDWHRFVCVARYVSRKTWRELSASDILSATHQLGDGETETESD